MSKRLPSNTHALLLGLVVIAVGAGAAAATPGGVAPPAKRLVVTVAHAAVAAENVAYDDTGTPGSSPGDVRSYYLPLTRVGRTRVIGFLTGTLTTVAIDRPKDGMELRVADLVFTVGGPADQIVLGGVASYAQPNATIAVDEKVVRPVVGGSGKYAGARGWCVSTHKADNTWTHAFHLTVDGR